MLKKIDAYFKKIKGMPETELKVFAYTVSGVLTFIIVSSSVVLPGNSLSASVSGSGEAVKSVASPFAILGKDVSATFSEIANNPTLEQIKSMPKTLMRAMSGAEKPSESVSVPPVISQEDILGLGQGTTTVNTADAVNNHGTTTSPFAGQIVP